MSMTKERAPMTSSITIETAQQAEAFCQHVEKVMHELMNILQHETQAARQGNIAALHHSEEEKARLSQNYVQARSVIKKNGMALSRLAPIPIEKLRRFHNHFKNELQINLAVIATVKSISEEIIKEVAEAVSTKRRVTVYGANGTISKSTTRHDSAIAVDRSF